MIINKIIIEFTDNPNDIRNNGEGDYFVDSEGNKVIRAYCQDATDKWKRWAFLCAMHEITEFELLDSRNIPEHIVDEFDRWFELKKLKGEPGDHPKSPYKKLHRSAEIVEMYLAERLNIDWHDYFKNYAIPEDFKYDENYGKDKPS